MSDDPDPFGDDQVLFAAAAAVAAVQSTPSHLVHVVAREQLAELLGSPLDDLGL